MGWSDVSSARVPRARPDAERRVSVIELVRLFELRRRAATDEFSTGVELAMSGAVRLHEVEDQCVTATVDAGRLFAVELRALDASLAGRCTCDSPTAKPCRHEVAVAHALWVRDWGQPPYGEATGRRR